MDSLGAFDGLLIEYSITFTNLPKCPTYRLFYKVSRVHGGFFDKPQPGDEYVIISLLIMYCQNGDHRGEQAGIMDARAP